MNDKCAAGTGRFIENTARALEISLLDFSNKSLVSRTPVKINSMCTVFAESEVISLLALGASLEDISAGVHDLLQGASKRWWSGLGFQKK